MRGSVSAHWWLPLDSISYTRLDAALGDEAEKLYVSAAAFLSRHQSVANYFSVDLAGLKVMARELAELFGLALPVTWKKQAHQTAGYPFVLELHVTTHLRELIGPSS
jgi:hypothetical protein